MATRVQSHEIDPDHPGSDNHLPLKDKDGGTPLDSKTGGDGVAKDVEKAIESSDADTEMADKLKAAVRDTQD